MSKIGCITETPESNWLEGCLPENHLQIQREDAKSVLVLPRSRSKVLRHRAAK